MYSSNTPIYSKLIVAPMLALSGWLIYSSFLAILFVCITAVSYIVPASMKYGLYVIYLFLLIGIIFTTLMILSLSFKRELLPFINTRFIWLKLFAPIARGLSKLFKLDYEKMVWSIITISNDFVANSLKGKTVKNISILLPHCLQLESCGRKITTDIRNCARCGKCVVDNLINISDDYKIDIFVATGGTVARQQIAKSRPELVIAVACERDLLSGIRDVLPMKAIGVINSRPNGPCVNTTVDTVDIENVIKQIKL